MTEQNETETTTKEKPAYYIFGKDDAGNSKPIGAAYAHKKGKGLNIVVGDKRFVAYPPKK